MNKGPKSKGKKTKQPKQPHCHDVEGAGTGILVSVLIAEQSRGGGQVIWHSGS